MGHVHALSMAQIATSIRRHFPMAPNIQIIVELSLPACLDLQGNISLCKYPSLALIRHIQLP